MLVLAGGGVTVLDRLIAHSSTTHCLRARRAGLRAASGDQSIGLIDRLSFCVFPQIFYDLEIPFL
jgi:hypothetical protein